MIPTCNAVFAVPHIRYSNSGANAAIFGDSVKLFAPFDCLVNRYILPFFDFFHFCYPFEKNFPVFIRENEVKPLRG